MPEPGPSTDPTSKNDTEVDLPGWIDNPERKIRNVVFGALLSGFASILNELFGAAELLVLGSLPRTFGAPNETWGLADLPAVLFRLTGDVLGTLIGSSFDILASLISGTIPATEGPLSGLIATAVIIVVIVAAVRLGGPLLLSGLEAIPIIGGPISSLLRGVL